MPTHSDSKKLQSFGLLSKYSFYRPYSVAHTARYRAAVLLAVFLLLPSMAFSAEARFFRLDGAQNLKQTAQRNTSASFMSLSGYRQAGAARPLIPTEPAKKPMELAALSSDTAKRTEALLDAEKAQAVEATPQKQASEAFWPLPAEATDKISSGYGYRIHPITGQRSFHDGIDIVAAPGTEVMSTGQGTVEEAGRKIKLGNYIRVRHEDGLISTYGHLSKILVKKDDIVRQGQVIGKLGSTGFSTGPHLHYAVKQGDKSIDPIKHLAQAVPVKTVEVARKAD